MRTGRINEGDLVRVRGETGDWEVTAVLRKKGKPDLVNVRKPHDWTYRMTVVAAKCVPVSKGGGAGELVLH